MRYYVEAYRADGSQILGNCDGQASLECRYPERTAHVRRLRREPAERLSLRGVAARYRIVTASGAIVATIDKSGAGADA